ncbi:putative ABC transporter type 1, transmembrane domain-containing protein [Helianthus anomalus]
MQVQAFVMNMATFGAAYIVAFLLLWRLAIVGLPFIIILVIPGLIYGRVLSRKIREEYSKADRVAHQAISSVNTVYSFVGENKTLTAYSAALENTMKLGLRLWGMGRGLGRGLVTNSHVTTPGGLGFRRGLLGGGFSPGVGRGYEHAPYSTCRTMPLTHAPP